MICMFLIVVLLAGCAEPNPNDISVIDTIGVTETTGDPQVRCIIVEWIPGKNNRIEWRAHIVQECLYALENDKDMTELREVLESTLPDGSHLVGVRQGSQEHVSFLVGKSRMISLK
ncbi:MAG: hypothetical protein ABIJ21_05155 [Nanoarchaeota archaeon]